VREEQGAQRQLTSSKGHEGMGISHYVQGTAFPSKGIFCLSFLSLSKNAPAPDFLCVQNKKTLYAG
jgi:hypothetical protein